MSYQEHPDYAEMGIFAGYGEYDKVYPIVDSTSWTGLPSGLKWGFKSDTQLPLFMVWREVYDLEGEVEYAWVIFTTTDWRLNHLWKWRFLPFAKKWWDKYCELCSDACQDPWST